MTGASNGVDWTVFCALWQFIGVFYAIRDAKPDDRNAPEVLAVLVVTSQAQAMTHGVQLARLIDAINGHSDEIDRLDDKLIRLAQRTQRSTFR